MKTKKILSLLVAMTMLFSCVGITAMAEESVSVAKIDETTYATLADAVANANADDTVTLVTNIVGDSKRLEISKDITLDLGGYTFTDAYIITSANVTIKNGSIKNTNEPYPIKVTSNALTVENITLEASKSDRAIWVDGGTLNFYNSSILATKGENNNNSKIYGVWVSKNTTANIYSGSITVDAGPDATAVAIFGNYVNTVNVYGGKLSTSGKNYSYAIWTEGDITVTGGEIVTNEKKYGYSSGITYGYNYAINTKGDVTISGGTITTNGFSGYLVNAAGTAGQSVKISDVEFTNVLTETDKDKGSHKAPELIKGNSVTVEISGGEFNGVADIKANYVAPGATITVDGEKRIKTENGLEKIAYVAKIGETTYETLKEALEAANEGDTIQLTAGTFEMGSVKFPATLKNITIKGAENKGTVIKDSLLYSADGGSVNYKGVTFDGIVFDGSQIVFTGNRNGEVVYKDWTIKNCEFKNVVSTANAAVHFNLAADETFEGLTFSNNVINGVSGGSVSGLRANYLSGNVTITGNNISNVAWNAVQIINANTTTFTVKENVFESSADEGILNLFNVKATDVTIEENQFMVKEGQPGIAYLASGDVSRNYWGGNAPANLPEGVTCSNYYTTNANGVLGGLVEIKAPVAQTMDADGNVVNSYSDFESAIIAAAADKNITRIEILSDYTQTSVVNTTEYNDITKPLTIGAPEGKNYTVTINVTGDSIALRVKDGGSLTIEENITIEGLDVVANGFATNGENMTIDGTLKALSLKQWTNNGAITIGETGSVWLGYGDGQFDLAYGNGTVTVNGNGDMTTPQFKAGYSDTRGNGNTLNLKDTYFEAGAWFNVNGSNGTINADNSLLKVSGGDSAGSLTIISSGNAINLSNGSMLHVANLTIGANNSVTLGSGCSIKAKTISGAGKIVVDAEGMTIGTIATISGNASGFTGTVEVINNNALEAKVEDGKIVLVAKPVAYIGDTTYATLEEAFAAATEGQTITLLADATPALTSQRAITKAATIDLGGNTLTLTEDDLYFGTTTFKNGDIVVDPSVKPSTAVFWMFANQTLTFDNVKITATGVTGTYLIGLDGNNSDLNLLNGSEIFVNNATALDLDIICVNASTGNDIVIDDSKVNVTNLDGRVFFKGNYTVSGNSDIDLSGITKAGFRIEAGQTLKIEDTSTVDIVGEPRDGGIHITDATAVYTVADTATVNATVNAPVAKIGDTTYTTFAAALDAVEDGEIITLMNVTGDESKTEIEFTKDIAFTITGDAPNYALPVVTFQNATVTIKDAEILTPELDARQNATINVLDSIVHDAGGNSIVKSYYNGAINISGTSVVYTMQVTTMGYITISDTAKLNATWQTNVYGNGMITVEDTATFATGALHLTGQDYSGRDNTDAERVGKPATIVVDGATLTAGKVYSDSGADYSYNSSHGINIGTIDGKYAVLDAKNGATVNIYMANGETANIGANGTVNVEGSALNVACRADNGTVNLANNGVISVNNGTINLTTVNATLTTPEDTLEVNSTVDGYEVVYADGKYSLKEIEKVELFDFYGASPVLGNSLEIDFYVAIDNFNGNGYKAVIEHDTASGIKKKEIPMSEWSVNSAKTHYLIEYYDITAKQITESMTVTIYDSNGTQVSVKRTDGIKAYAERMLAQSNTSEKLKTTLVDMLNYGAAAQKQFNYRTDMLANADLTEEQQLYASKMPALENVRPEYDTSIFAGTSLVLRDNILMDVYFKGATEGMYAEVTYTKHSEEKAKTYTYYYNDFETSGNYKILSINTLVIADAKQMVDITIYNADGSVYATYKDNMNSYLARQLEKEDAESGIYSATAKFTASSYDYLH